MCCVTDNWVTNVPKCLLPYMLSCTYCCLYVYVHVLPFEFVYFHTNKPCKDTSFLQLVITQGITGRVKGDAEGV